MDEIYYKKRGFGNEYVYQGAVHHAKISCTFGKQLALGRYSVYIMARGSSLYAQNLTEAKAIAEAYINTLPCPSQLTR